MNVSKMILSQQRVLSVEGLIRPPTKDAPNSNFFQNARNSTKTIKSTEIQSNNSSAETNTSLNQEKTSPSPPIPMEHLSSFHQYTP